MRNAMHFNKCPRYSIAVRQQRMLTMAWSADVKIIRPTPENLQELGSDGPHRSMYI